MKYYAIDEETYVMEQNAKSLRSYINNMEAENKVFDEKVYILVIISLLSTL